MTTQSSCRISQGRYRLRAQAKLKPGSKRAKKFMYRVKDKKTKVAVISTHAEQVKDGTAGQCRVAQRRKHDRVATSIRVLEKEEEEEEESEEEEGSEEEEESEEEDDTEEEEDSLSPISKGVKEINDLTLAENMTQGHKRKWKATLASQQQGQSTIPPLRTLSMVGNLPLAQVSMARRRKQVIRVMPPIAEEEESGGDSEYFSAPSSPLLDRREPKRRRGEAESARSSPAPDEGELKCLVTNRRSRNEQDEDEEVQEITRQDWLKSVIGTRPARSFIDLPDSIILQIVDTLHEQDDGKLVSSVCFGLTCRRYWSFFKVWWCCPGWNMIYNDYLPKKDQALLAPLLQNWVPEKYRIMSGIGAKAVPSFVPMFLLKRQYGEGYTKRRKDWRRDTMPVSQS
ncbi:hypothetical protein EAF04_007097 [Stromatinia cepivora]|nr:hypothetical protein EAF04_007097 [Stromatinia cepivora]